MQRKHPEIPWCRYADDGLLHCKTEQQAQALLLELRKRFVECGLEIHPGKTKIVYCKDASRKGSYPNVSFDFLGYTFRPRSCKNSKLNKLFVGFTPAVSKNAIKSMQAKTKKLNWRKRTELSLEEIAKSYNPVLMGWLNYYGKYSPSALYPVWRHFNNALAAWAMKKYKNLRGRKMKTTALLEKISKEQPNLFAHWKAGMRGAFA